MRRLRSTVWTQRVTHSSVRAAGGGKARAKADGAAPGSGGAAPLPVSGPLAGPAPDTAGPGAPGSSFPTGSAPSDPEHAAIWEALQRLTKVVENDHQHRLERIENDLKWVMRLATAVLAAVLGAAAGDFLPK